MNVQIAAASSTAFYGSNLKQGSSVSYSTDLTADDKTLLNATYGSGWDRMGSGPNDAMKPNIMAFGIVAARRNGTLEGPVTAKFITQEFGYALNMKNEFQAALDYLKTQFDGQQVGKTRPVSFTA